MSGPPMRQGIAKPEFAPPAVKTVRSLLAADHLGDTETPR
jgi:hypothetical protein